MRSFFSQHSRAVLWSIALHGAIAAALTLGFRFPHAYRPTGQHVAIEATVVDAAAIREEQQRLKAEQRAEAERRAEQARLERQRQEAAERKAQEEAARKAKEAAALEARKEAARQAQAEAARKAEEAARKAKEAAALAAKQAAERKAREEAARQAAAEEAKRKAAEEAKRKAEEEAKRKAAEEAERKRLAEEERKRKEAEAVARQKAQAEADLQSELAAEEERMKARQSGLEDQYVNLLKNRIEQNWNRPPSAQKGLDCWVNVTQIPSGEVISVSVDQCNGDDAVVQSIERAVRRASPLPLPPVQALFERNLRFEFKPDE